MVNLNNLVYIKLYGEGHYSGQTATQCIFVTKEFFTKYEDTITGFTPYFGELDGKHSNVQGDVIITTDDMVSCLKDYVNEAEDDYMFWDEMFSELDEDQTESMYLLNKEINELLKVETETHYYFDGKEI